MIQLVSKHGTKKWSLIGSYLVGRTGKQCRERYFSHLFPSEITLLALLSVSYFLGRVWVYRSGLVDVGFS